VQIFEALEQARVEIFEIAMCGEQRRGLRVRRLQRVIGVRAVDRLERILRTFEQEARTFHLSDGIVECRGGLLVCDGSDLALLLGHAGKHRREVIFILDPREVGSLERQGARLRERIGSGQRRGCSGGALFGRCAGWRGRNDRKRRGRQKNVADHHFLECPRFSCGASPTESPVMQA